MQAAEYRLQAHQVVATLAHGSERVTDTYVKKETAERVANNRQMHTGTPHHVRVYTLPGVYHRFPNS